MNQELKAPQFGLGCRQATDRWGSGTVNAEGSAFDLASLSFAERRGPDKAQHHR